MAKNSDLGKAKAAKKDEFYTQLNDIVNELRHYKEHFRDKVVLCNCDDPYESNFFKFFALNFNSWGLKKLICTCYNGSPITGRELDIFENNNMVAEGALRERLAYKIELTHVHDINGDGAIDFKDIDIILRQNPPELLAGSGDFRSKECIEILKQADIVCTNPPFSLFRQYLAQLFMYDKKFLIIGNVNAITYKEVFPLIKDNKMWLGPSITSGDRKFNVPDDYPLDAAGCGIDENGNKFIRVKGVRWFTNLDHKKRHEEMDLWKQYTPEEYPKYYNYDAIEVNKTSDIPCDYEGIMGVPITFLDKFNPNQFEIVGTDSKDTAEQLGIKPIGKQWCDIYFSQGGTGHMSPAMRNVVLFVNGKAKTVYKRIFIRKKK